jgi:tetratricopeptide (TPR) repeat protein
MKKTLCVLVLSTFAAVLSACSKTPELIRVPLNKKDPLLETIIIDDEYVKKADKERATEYFRKGETYFALDMFEEAFKEYWHAYELDKKVVYIDGLGVSSIKLKRLGDARYFLEESYRANPDRIEPFSNLAFVDMLEGNYSAAEKKYKALIRHVPNNLVINYNLGQAILVSVIVGIRKERAERRDVSDTKNIILNEKQVRRLREARRYLANVASLPVKKGTYATGSEIAECKSHAKKTIKKIDHALAKYPR